ncbi:MAG: IclR family transcriptional regulator, partial [Alphaproteobacteria bacterium]
ELQRTSGLTIQLTVFVGDRRLVLDVRYGAERLVPFYDTNLTRPLHSSATGKLLLASLGEEQWRRMLGPEPFAAFTARTLTTYDALRRELAETLERGYSLAVDEAIMGLTAIAAPIRNRGQPMLGCLAAYGPSQALLGAELDRAATATRHAADLLSFLAPSVQPLGGLLLPDAGYE